ncbi:MAG: S9 family peptidase [Ignavibacteriaceae bacterium]|nr:S9 family peptidase [Ignavibacteriaceae bacterium]
MIKSKFCLSLLVTILISFSIIAQTRRSINVDDLWAMKRISSFDVSPDGKTIVYTITSYSFEANKGNTDIFMIDSDGKNNRPLKNSDKNESEPEFSPDGKTIAFMRRGQIWQCELDGTNEKQLTDIYSGVSEFEWSPDGKKILFASFVYPDCKTQDCIEQKDKAKEESKLKAEIFTSLMYRHWNDWRGDKRSHLFLLDAVSGNYIDLTEGIKEDVPPLALGSSDDYNFSPDGSEIAYSLNPEFTKATSTNIEIYLASLTSPQTPKLISVSNGVDCQPVYSPDGEWLAWTSMKRAGFEADKKDLILFNRKTGEIKNLTEDYDRSVDEIIWSPDSKIIYFTAGNGINNSIYKLNVEEEEISIFLEDNYNTNIQLSKDGKTLFFLKQRSDLPNEIFSLSTDGKNTLKRLTFTNEEILSQLEMNPVETFWCEGANGDKVQSIIIKPPFFDPNKKYPMMFLIHGGPQGAWEDNFHYRWNLQMFAGAGYVVIAPNPRGSTGYGQKFTDEISKDWGGKVYVDLMNTYDYAINNFKFIDQSNTFAAGASYGGYMINWIAGHTDRFSALFCHNGTFNLESMWGTTEELWFPEWDIGGTPWENRDAYEKWSPHRYIQNAKTPMLIVHSAFDFRLSEEQAFQLFTSLQRLGVESKFLYFPDETHFVSKPQNAKLWWTTVFEWFKSHLKQEKQ